MYNKHEFNYSVRLNEQDELLDKGKETNIEPDGKLPLIYVKTFLM